MLHPLTNYLLVSWVGSIKPLKRISNGPRWPKKTSGQQIPQIHFRQQKGNGNLTSNGPPKHDAFMKEFRFKVQRLGWYLSLGNTTGGPWVPQEMMHSDTKLPCNYSSWLSRGWCRAELHLSIFSVLLWVQHPTLYQWINNWVVATQIFLEFPSLYWKKTNLTHTFQMGCNHQLDKESIQFFLKGTILTFTFHCDRARGLPKSYSKKTLKTWTWKIKISGANLTLGMWNICRFSPRFTVSFCLSFRNVRFSSRKDGNHPRCRCYVRV